VTGRIPQHFIDELMQRADIVEVVGSRVPLKKAGREYKACCPFHGEKTPSFTVSPDKGFYHCFGCGAHGTALGFIMEFDRLEFVAAVEELAGIYGLEVPREDPPPGRAPLAPVFAVLGEAAVFFQEALKNHPSAVDYLKSRGLDGDTAREFRLGYAPPAWDSLLRALGATESRIPLLLAAGLVVPRDGGGHYDRFRDRIMFPIRDSRGRVVGFGGRVIGAGEPKYLNSPETAVFHKGQELYGVYEAKQAERRLAQLLVVEGYMDVVSLARHGVRNVVATLGTATTGEHVRRLFRIVADIVFCFDGDRAGRAAAWRALQTSLPEIRDGRQVRFLFLPDGEDPDSLVRKEGAQAFGQRLEQSQPLSEYLIAELRQQSGTDSLDARARLAELARPLINLVPQGVYRELLTDRLAAEVGMNRSRLDQALGGKPAAAPAPTRTPRPARVAAVRPSLIRQAISLVLRYPGIAGQVPIPAGFNSGSQRGLPLLAELMDLVHQNPALTPGALVERFRDRPEGRHLADLLAEDLLVGEDAAARELAGSLERIVLQGQEERLAELVSKASGSSLTAAEKDEFRELQKGRNRTH
jgi:DNA primase